MRQKCPLSFAIVLGVLIRGIKQEEILKNIQTGKEQIFIYMFE